MIMSMRYIELCEFYEKLESTTKRLEMIDILVNLFRKTPKEIIDKVVYLTQGKIYPDYVGIELGIAEKLALRAAAKATGWRYSDIMKIYRKCGDLGLAVEEVLKKRKQASFFLEELTVSEVYSTLEKIAKASGAGSQDIKIRNLAGLLARAQPKEARYLLRTLQARLRLGIADMTILEALALAFTGSRSEKPKLERAYNLCSDLGAVAKAVAEKGIEGIEKFGITIGRPIRPMLAQRLSSAEEILAKLGGKASCEWKYDGERAQIHKENNTIYIFSRRLENITHQYPDVVEYARRGIMAREAIVEGEIVAIDPETGEMRPFQELMHRKRKHEIEEAVRKIPVRVFLFDVLYVDGEDFTNKDYLTRVKKLEEIINKSENFTLVAKKILDDPQEIEKFFEEAIESGCEGLIMKSIGPDSKYQAGARGWLWIKLKRSYQSKMVEPIDLVIVGGFYGKGKRAGTYGALLCAVYNKEDGVFETISKVGSGFTDEELANLPKKLEPYKREDKPINVRSVLEPDVWFEPALVIEVIGDELTLSPVHTCAQDKIRKGSGIAVRFPRFTGRWREDKSPEDATTTEEIIEMYNSQLKKIEETV